jgi:hypothetical protein
LDLAIGALNNNAWYAYDYLQKKHGYTPAQAAGIVGNLMQESTFMTNARNKGDGRDGTDSIGIGQWNGARGKGLLNFAASNQLDADKLDTQLDYLHHELQTKEQGSYQRLMAADNVQDATAAMIGYERPRGYSAKNPSGGDGWNNRLAWATQALSGDRSGSAPAPVGTLGSLVAGSTGTPSAGSSALVASAQPGAQIANPDAGKSYSDGLIAWTQNHFGNGAPVQPATVAASADGKPDADRGLLEKLGMGSMPDKVLGVETNKGLKAFGSLASLMSAGTAAQNQQVQAATRSGQARRAANDQVEIKPMGSIAMQSGGSIGGSSGNATDEEKKKQMLLALLGLGGGGGLLG